MNHSDEEILHQLRLGEDSRWEFKQVEFRGDRPSSPSRNDWADEIAAFANADGGTVLCGVTDAGDVRGMTRRQMDEMDRLLVEVCTDAIRPAIRPVILRKELEEGKPFLLLEISKGHTRHDSPGGSFHRVGGSKRRMTSDERCDWRKNGDRPAFFGLTGKLFEVRVSVRLMMHCASNS